MPRPRTPRSSRAAGRSAGPEPGTSPRAYQSENGIRSDISAWHVRVRGRRLPGKEVATLIPQEKDRDRDAEQAREEIRALFERYRMTARRAEAADEPAAAEPDEPL